MPTGRVDSVEHRMMIGWEQLWSWYLIDVTRHAVASCRTRTARYHRWTVDSAPELFLMTSSFRNPPPVNQRHTHDTMWCVTLLTMLLLEVTRTSCCYHHLPLTAEVFLLLVLYVSGTTCQLMWTLQVCPCHFCFTCLLLRSVCGTGNSSQQTSLQCLSTVNMVFGDKDKILIETHKYIEELKSVHLKYNLFAFSSISAEYLQKIWIFNFPR